ncbi:MAG: TonB-dependent receptor, partial [Candidatus Binataceae bacterium]
MRRVLVFAIGLWLCSGAILMGARLARAQSQAAPPDPLAGSPAKQPAPDKASQKKISGETAAAGYHKKLPRMVIVVTATRMATPLSEVGTSASVVTQKLMQSQQLHDATNALREVPGVVVTQSGGAGAIADISIRGATPAQTLVMIDGVPINDSATSSFDVSRIMTDSLSQIEVVRGAGGALYGSQAIGGVVNFISAEGSGPAKFSLTSEGGNRASVLQVATANGADGKLAYNGALSYATTEGFRPVNDSSDNLSGSMRLDYHLDENTTLRAFGWYTRANLSLANYTVADGISLDPTAHQRNEFMLYKGEIDHQFGDKLETRSYGFFVRDVLNINAPPFSGYPVDETDSIPDETRGANLEAIYTWSKSFRSLIGYDFKDRWVHSQSNFFFLQPPPVSQSLTVFNARRQEYAGYVEQEARLFDGRVIGTAGFRVDGNSDFGEEVSPAWAVAIPLEEGLTLRGSYSEGFRAPSFDELYFPGFGNPNLNPEISSEWDGGFTKSFGEVAEFTATYFSRRVHDLIVTVPCTINPTNCQFGATDGNAARVDTQGVEIIPSVHPMQGLTLSGSVTYLDQSHESLEPNTEPLRVPNVAAAALSEYT